MTIVPSWGTNGLLLFAASGSDTGFNLRIHDVAPSSSKRLFDSTPLYRTEFSSTRDRSEESLIKSISTASANWPDRS
jgi:hypothetical protein